MNAPKWTDLDTAQERHEGLLKCTPAALERALPPGAFIHSMEINRTPPSVVDDKESVVVIVTMFLWREPK